MAANRALKAHLALAGPRFSFEAASALYAELLATWPLGRCALHGRAQEDLVSSDGLVFGHLFLLAALLCSALCLQQVLPRAGLKCISSFRSLLFYCLASRSDRAGETAGAGQVHEFEICLQYARQNRPMKCAFVLIS